MTLKSISFTILLKLLIGIFPILATIKFINLTLGEMMNQVLDFQQIQKSIDQVEKADRKNNVSGVTAFCEAMTAGRSWTFLEEDRSVYGSLKNYANNPSNSENMRKEAKNYVQYIDNLRDRYDLNKNEWFVKKTGYILAGSVVVLGASTYFGLFGRIYNAVGALLPSFGGAYGNMMPSFPSFGGLSSLTNFFSSEGEVEGQVNDSSGN